MLHFILSPLSRRGLQTLLRWRSSRSHKPRPAAAAGCRLGEPDRNINIMLHQHSIYVRWRCSEVKPLSQVHQALHHPASRHLRRNYNGYYFLTFSVFTHLKKTKKTCTAHLHDLLAHLGIFGYTPSIHAVATKGLLSTCCVCRLLAGRDDTSCKS